MVLTRLAKSAIHEAEWSFVSIETSAVMFRPSFSGLSKATRRSMTPSASSRWMRFQHGVCDKPTRPPISAIDRVASSCRSARMFRSVASISDLSFR